MDTRLHRLIQDYQVSVYKAVQSLHASGVAMPRSGTEWLMTEIAQSGVLDGNIRYHKHGVGCAIWLPNGPVDFDFGEGGEIDGFSVSRVAAFAAANLEFYGFETPGEIKDAFAHAIEAGEIVCTEPTICYLAGSPRVLAVDIR